MEINESKAERVCGIIVFVFGLILYFFIIPMTIKDITTQGISPRALPQALTLLMTAFSVPLFIGGYKKRNDENQKIYTIKMVELKLVVISLLIMAANIVCYGFIGYLPTTIISLAALQWIFGQRGKLKIILTSVLTPVVIWLFFVKVLIIFLP